MKNVTKLLVYLLAMVIVISGIFGLTACNNDDEDNGGTDNACSHEWADATCTDAKHCTKCDAKEGEALGHNFADATCSAAKTCKSCGVTEGEKLTHKGGTATCQNAAVCELCGSTYGEKADHKWIGANCTEARHCKDCGATDGEKLGHTGGEATCEVAAVCERCGSSYGEKADHNFTKATCTEAKTCIICGETEGEALGHTGGEATCKYLAVCTSCGASYGELLDHSYTEKKVETIFRASVATCETPATYYYTCACGAMSEETFADGEALGHDYRYVQTEAGTHVKFCANETDVTGGTSEQCSGGEATCTDEAVCQFCGNHYGSVLGHAWNAGETTPATCIADGKTVYTCKICGETKTDVIVATGHSFTATKTVEPKCVTEGYTVYTCSGCGDSYNADKVVATGHAWEGVVTCDSGRECKSCGEKEAALGHSYKLTVTPATCTTAAVNNYKCETCQDTYSETVGGPLGHSTVGVTPTKRVISVCEYVEVFVCANEGCSVEIDGDTISEHTHVASITTAATCTTAGVKTLVCSKCNDTKTEEIPANETGHSWTEGAVANGERTDTCANCGTTKKVTVYTGNITDATNASDLKDKEIQLDNANIKLDDGVVDAIGDKKVTVSADIATDDDLADLNIDPDKLAQVGNNPIYNFTISDGDANISQFGEMNFVTITLPYTLEEGEDIDSIAVWFINDKGELESIKATYNNGYVTFKTNHFSYYTVTRLTPRERCDLYGHNLKVSTVVGDCLTDGYVFELCVRCHYSNKTTTSVGDGHDYTENVIAATCTTDGSATYTCVDCGHSYQVKLNKLGHTVVEVERVLPTCENDGYVKSACQNAGCDYENVVVIPKLNHTYKTTVVAPTCESAGYTLYDCVNCDYSYTDNVVAALGHSYTHKFVWSEDHSEAYIVFVCANDDAHNIEKAANVTVKTTAATCQSEGEKVYTAKVVYNGETYTDVYTEVIPKIDHGDDFRWMSNSHEHWKKCDCGNRIGVEDHVFDTYIVVEEATCKKGGEIVYICSAGCGRTQKEKTDKIDHVYVETSRTEATCVSDGLIVTTCKGCGDTVKEKIPSTGDHVYVETSRKDATCALDGEIIKTCHGCKGEIKEAIPATGKHVYEETSRTEPTCALDGEVVTTCSGCGDVIKEAIPATGKHVYEETSRTEPTCTLDGEVVTTCSGCGDVIKEAIPATGKHVYEETSRTEPTCAAAGEIVKTCSGCGDVLKEELPIINKHSYAVTDEKDATCGADGYVTETCSVCGKENTTTRPATGKHSYDEKGICSGCGKFEGDCDHKNFNKVTVNLADYGCCEGTFVFEMCDCGAVVYMNDEPDIDCDLETEAYEEIENEDGSYTAYMIGRCTECGLYIEASMYEAAPDGCNRYSKEVYTIYASEGGELIVKDAIMEYFGTNHSSEYVKVDLTEYGICGGTMSAWQCRDCGEFTSFGNLDPICTDVSMGEETFVDAKGFEHYVQWASCNKCGLRMEMDYYEDVRSVCETVIYATVTVSCNGTVIIVDTENEYDDSHEYQTEYVLIGESCEDGILVKRLCTKCGESGEYTSFGHVTEEQVVNLSDFGFCGGYIRNHVCKICGEVTNSYVEDYYCNWHNPEQEEGGYDKPGYEKPGVDNPEYDKPIEVLPSMPLDPEYDITVPDYNVSMKDTAEYTDVNNGFGYDTGDGDFGYIELPGGSISGGESGGTGSGGNNVRGDYLVCYNCGGEKRTSTETIEGDNSCTYIQKTTTIYYMNGVEVYNYTRQYTMATHSYEYTYEMMGETCENGVRVYGVCTVCGETTEYYTGGHNWTTERVYFDTLGMCGGFYRQNVCSICGKKDVSIDVEDYDCNWIHRETVGDTYYYYCEKCGAEKAVTETYGEKNDFCDFEVFVKRQYIVNGVCVLDVESVYYRTEHNFEDTIEMNGATCDEGGYLIRTCKDCGQSHREDFWGHYTVGEEIQLGDLGMCGGYAHMSYCRICGFKMDGYVDDYNCSWEYNGMNSSGAEVYTCVTCGTVKHCYRAGVDKDENCYGKVYYYQTYYLNGNEIYSMARFDGEYECHNIELVVEKLGVSCDDGIRYTYTCKDCEYSNVEEIYYHRETEYQHVNLSDYGLCGGYAYAHVCKECNRVTDSYVNDYSCNWNYLGNDEGVEMYQCLNCGTVRHTYREITEKDANCVYQEINNAVYFVGEIEVYRHQRVYYYDDHNYGYSFVMNGATCGDGGTVTSTCKDCGYSYDSQFESHFTVEERVDFSDLGMCEGGYGYMYVCQCCGEITNGWWNGNCNWNFKETTDAGVEIHECMNCGAVKYWWHEQTAKDANCQYKHIYHNVFYVGGVEVYHHYEVNTNTEHTYEYSFVMNGATCDEGGTVTFTCKDCGYTYDTIFSGHYTAEERVEFVNLGMCGGYAYMSVCQCCGWSNYGYTDHYSCNWSHKETTEAGVDVYECSNCGAIRHTWTEKTEKDANCSYKNIYHNVYYMSGVEVYHHMRTSTSTSHDYEYSFVMNGATCQEGGTVTRTCKACGYSYNEYFSGHFTAEERVEFSDFGMCNNCYAYMYICRCCGEITSGGMNISWCNWNHKETTDAGVQIYECTKCGVVKHYWNETTAKDANCSFKYIEHNVFYVGGVEVYHHQNVNRNEAHVYGYSFNMNGATCQEGGTVTLTCEDCGYSYNEYFSGHYTAYEKVNFVDLGMCENGYGYMYVCRCCGEITSGGTNERCSWNHKETTDAGVDVYECSNCGAIRHIWTEKTEKDANCQYKTVYHKVYYVGGVEVYHHQNVNRNEAHVYGYSFNMNGATCQEGGTVTVTCEDCGYSYDSNFNGHYTTQQRVEFVDLGMCKGGYAYMYVCQCCGEITSGYWSYNCSWSHKETTDAGVKIYECTKCGAWRYAWSETTEKDANCQYKVISHNSFYVNGEEVYHLQSPSYYDAHNYEYTFEMNGTTCAEGGKVTVTCKDCGYSYNDTFSGHYTAEERVEFVNLGMCNGGYGYMYVCQYCGEITGGYWGYNCSWSRKETTAEGVQIYECTKCGAWRHYWTETTEKDANCQYKNIYHNVFYVNGVEVYHHQEVSNNSSHTYNYSFELQGTSCTDGVYVTYTCKDCGYNYRNHRTYHENFIVEQYDLTAYGACRGTYYVRSCPCGQNKSWSANLCDTASSADSTYLDDNGILHYVRLYTCNTCDMRIQEDKYTVRDKSICKSVTYYSISAVVGANPVTLTEYTTMQDAHDYKVTGAFMEGATDCNDGVILTYACKDCTYSYTSNTYSHTQFEINRYDLYQYGAECKGYLVEKSCLCGYSHSISMDEMLCNRDQKWCNNWISDALNVHSSYPYFYYSTNSYIYTCSVTDPQCAFKIRYAEYALKVAGKCAAQWHQTWQIGYNPETDTCLLEITFAYGDEQIYHPYVSTTVSEQIDANNRKSETVYECPDCGTYYSQTWYYTKAADGYEWESKYELIYENKLNNGQNKFVEYSRETIYHKYPNGSYNTYRTLEREKVVRGDGTVSEYQYLYEYDFNYVAPFGDYAYVRTTTYTSTSSSDWKREEAFVVYKGHTFELYYYNISNYGAANESWERRDYTYDFTNGCQRSYVYTNSNGDRVEYGFTSCHPGSYNYITLKPSTCTQDGAYAHKCPVCEQHIREGVISPIAHSWYQLGDSHYICRYCGLENANGASGEIVIEDLTSKYGNDEYYVLGYWNRGSVKFMYYVSLLFEDGYDEFIDIEIIEMDGIRAFAISKAEILAMAEALGYAEGTYNVMFTFVPVGADGSDDYAIVFTDEEPEVTEISDSAAFTKMVYADETVTIKVIATETAVWTFTSDAEAGYTGSRDTYGYLYDENGNLLAANDDYRDNQFFITYTLEAGKTYELRVRWFSSDNFGPILVIATKG